VIGTPRTVSADGPLFSIDGRGTFPLSGEFHYFRLQRERWGPRLRQMRDLGLTATSIYIPWNWHQPNPDDAPDLEGRTSPERDLRGAMEEIAAAGLDCIFRPGPFITAEWRNGGIPDWLWDREPGVRPLDADGDPSLPDHPYPGVTVGHPAYRDAVARWLEAACGVASEHLATGGGPVIDVQLDDEPSYFQLLPAGATTADYNPVLIASPAPGEPSRFGAWVLDRHGSLDAVNAAYRTRWSRAEEIEPPRTDLGSAAELPRHGDWFDFKLYEVNLDMEWQYGAVVAAGIDVPISMLFPYLLSLNAVRFTDFIEERGLPIHLTDEVYLSLFGPASSDERKLGDVLASHEAYTGVWLRGHGPAFAMELQGANSTNITPGGMEILYAVTVARGIKGINIYMLVGGENPPGFENVTGRGYDISAVISPDGTERPHAGVLRKLARVIEAAGPALLDGEPARDVWLGQLASLERAALLGGHGPLAEVGHLIGATFSNGDMGMGRESSLASLLAVSSVSFGEVDLERATPAEIAALPQVWIPGAPHLDRDVQERLVAALAAGADLVIGPQVPRRDERGEPCDLLWDAIMGGVEARAPHPKASAEAMHMLTTPQGESIVAPGARWSFDLPAGADAIAHDVRDGRCVAFTRSVGTGTVTVLGFHLQYVPNEQDDQKDFVERLVTRDGRRPLATKPTDRRVAAMQLSAAGGSFVCLANPVELPATTRVRATAPDGRSYTFPQRAEGVAFESAGARLLPLGLDLGGGVTLAHSTWELLNRVRRGDVIELTFATPGVAPGEILVSGAPVTGISGATPDREPSADVLVLRPAGDTCTLTLGGGAVAYTDMTDTNGGAR
jgi:beta-galactosidase